MRFSLRTPAKLDVGIAAGRVAARTLRVTALVLAAASLSACSQVVALEAATDSNNPKCAEISVRLPSDVAGFQQRDTNAQATSAWGTPSAVIIRCGLPPVFASTLKCVTAGGVDWLVDPEQAPNYRFITFGRNPATEVIVDSKRASGVSALEAVAPAVLAGAKASKICTALPN